MSDGLALGILTKTRLGVLKVFNSFTSARLAAIDYYDDVVRFWTVAAAFGCDAFRVETG